MSQSIKRSSTRRGDCSDHRGVKLVRIKEADAVEGGDDLEQKEKALGRGEANLDAGIEHALKVIRPQA
jgi:hypothetical protein